MSQSTSRFVTVKHFNAGIALLHSRNDALQAELRTRTDALQNEWIARTDALQSELLTRTDAIQTGLNAKIDKVCSDLRAEIARSILIAAGVITAAVGLMITVLGILLANGLLLPLPPS